MKKQQKTETPQNITELSPFLDKNVISRNKNMKNKANLTGPNFTATPCGIGSYSDFHPKIQNGTKPNKANFSPLHRRGFPLLSRRIHAFLKILFLGSKPNFPTQRITATTCSGNTYNDFYPQTNKKNKPKTNPKQTQNKPNFGEKANFPTLSPNP
ncbi:MAG TPA: hypothetical protein ENH94_09090 [Phycisphaerales bacterium]|nr:hypothetical protein [Phycisphaerales bacterium]